MSDPTAWQAVFQGDASADAYRTAMRALTPLSWEVIQGSDGDLLRYLVGKVPADIGATVILGLSVLFSGHPKADQASVSVLATITSEVEPGHARTLLLALSDAWRTVSSRAIDERPTIMAAEFARALRRVRASASLDSERNALDFLQSVLDGIPAR